MKELDEPFRKDSHGLWYIDANDVHLEPFKFHEMCKPYSQKTTFYKIGDISDYIVKDTTLHPLLFNRIRTMNFLKYIQQKQDYFNEIDFSVGYCKDKGILKGTIIPFYDGAMSLREFIYLHKLEELENLYYRDPSTMNNLLALFLDILDLIHKMYKNDVIYLDIHSGNFLFYKNSIKIIDFEPGYVFFDKGNNAYYKKIITNYAMLIEKICKRLGFEQIFLTPSDTFMDMEVRVKGLVKGLKR